VISWDAPSSEILLNPRLPDDEAVRVRHWIDAVPALSGHVWLTTSGSSGRLKPVALSKRALLLAAAAVNQHLDSDARDVWLNVLPTFHVGGLGIHARAHLSGARVVSLDQWRTDTFLAAIGASFVTLTALTPTHVFDLTRERRRCPASVRAVVVGGGALDGRLYRSGRALGWPLLPSYGATECCSQIATASLASLADDRAPTLEVLPHATVRIEREERIAVRSEALFTGYAGVAGLDDPKREGWWLTDDLGALRAGQLIVHGRADDTVKVGGELVNLSALESRLGEVVAASVPAVDAALFAATDARLGHAITLAVATSDPAVADRLLVAFNAKVLPFERARRAQCVLVIPRTPLGKVSRRALGDAVR
jgi:o-succinylbenzoate---CoA ligase